jgi:hypothetical protein
MLFMIVAKHTPEMCPGGLVRPDKEFSTKIEESMKKAGVKKITGYMNAPSHIFYFILETDDNEALNNAVEPLRLIGEVIITPVLTFSENWDWAKTIGIQK